jgi:hypothetical protein
VKELRVMKKWTVLAATGGVWLSAIGSAAALTYVLGGSPVPRVQPVAQDGATAIPSLDTRPSQVLEVPAPGTLETPTVTIVGHFVRSAPSRVARVVAPAPALVPPLGEMKCADWRGLDMGSGRAQVCQ